MSTPIVFSLEDFLAENFNQPLFLVDKIIPTAGRPGIIFGKRGSGKSHFANNLIKAIADGTHLLGRYKTRQGKVTYLSVDMPVQMVQERSGKLASTVNNWGNVQISVTDTPIDIVKTRPDEQWVKEIMSFEPDLLIIDTLRKIHRLDENDNQTVAILQAALARIFGGQIAIALIHHERKDNEHSNYSPLEERASGAGAWMDSGEFGIHIAKAKKQVPPEVTVRFPRVRHCADQDPILTHMDISSMSLVPHTTALERGRQILHQNPTYSVGDVAQKLEEEGLVKSSQAYRIAGKVCGKQP